MEIIVTQNEGSITLSLIGCFDKPNSKNLLFEATKANKFYIIDLAKIEFAASYFASALIMLNKKKVKFKLINTPEYIKELLELTGITNLAEIS